MRRLREQCMISKRNVPFDGMFVVILFEKNKR